MVTKSQKNLGLRGFGRGMSSVAMGREDATECTARDGTENPPPQSFDTTRPVKAPSQQSALCGAIGTRAVFGCHP
jgi:hypothetical protein